MLSRQGILTGQLFSNPDSQMAHLNLATHSDGLSTIKQSLGGRMKTSLIAVAAVGILGLSGCTLMAGPLQDSPISEVIDRTESQPERKTDDEGNLRIRANDEDDLWKNLTRTEREALCLMYRSDAEALRRELATVNSPSQTALTMSMAAKKC